ncbi:3-oxoadipyl-CoA thiolase [Hymenobacter wooponensis]|uniref:Beta-ketoadipyl-CoA thiolase n=1 Tax=Hymenobacter wooponensis TaxID=1525360 RepID=A0A4Z0MT32_9BACT|nr:3-oxoadipyl-CoA thiolase [Hymenobacter wooponensis]TGD82407.1 3-oxoadipyl-CoA thiolase [Hymenobacter wooponensis]
MNQAYIIDGIRTPIGNFGGTLSAVRPDDMAAHVIQELLKRNASVDPAAIADVILGCANQAGEDNRNVARMALLLAGLPTSVPGETVNRLCASGLSASIGAARALQSGDGDLFISGGVESMTRAPYVMSKPSKAFGTDSQMYDSSFGWRFINARLEEAYGTDAMGETAENLVDRYGISREDQDQFAYESHQRAGRARDSGRFAEEIVPVSIPQRKGELLLFAEDEFIKSNTTLEGLAKLRPAFRKNGGSVTAGNSSGLNDGAAALLLASEEGIKQHGLTPRARIVSMGVAGVEPRYMGIGPVPASQQALKKAGLTLDQIGLIEFNEAFAAQTLACARGLGLEGNDPRINPNGGAIALGHPLGMSGARILNTAALELHKQNKRYALITMCVGVGQGYAAIIEKV